jgi:hypothetical protein
MFPPRLETHYTQLALHLFEIRNLSLQPLQGPVLGAVTHRDLWKRADIAVWFVCWLWNSLWTVSAPITSQVGLFVCFLYRFWAHQSTARDGLILAQYVLLWWSAMVAFNPRGTYHENWHQWHALRFTSLHNGPDYGGVNHVWYTGKHHQKKSELAVESAAAVSMHKPE